MYQKYFKRLVDILCSLAAIIVFSWLYIIVAILVRIKLGSPVIFKQARPGKNEKIFNLYKFRTMTDVASFARLFVKPPPAPRFVKVVRRINISIMKKTTSNEPISENLGSS